MEQFGVISDSGGAGRFRGGVGFRRDYRIRSASRFAGGTVRSHVPAHGVLGGLPGQAARVIINPGTDSETTHTGMVSNLLLQPGDLLRIETGSAGGVGPPEERNRARVAEDVRNGHVSTEAARDLYGLASPPG